MGTIEEDKIHEEGQGSPLEEPPAVPDTTVKFVIIRIKRTYTKRLVNSAIVQTNSNVEVEEADDVFIIKAPYIKVKRSDVEAILGGISDTKWRMLFMNRTGEVREFTSYEFAIGVPQPSQAEIDRRELVQVNFRLPKDLKDEMENLRSPEILAMSQNDFISEAIAEYVAMLKRERV